MQLDKYDELAVERVGIGFSIEFDVEIVLVGLKRVGLVLIESSVGKNVLTGATLAKTGAAIR